MAMRSSSRSRSFETKVGGAFIAAVLVVFALFFSTWKVAQDANDAMHRVVRTHEMLHSLAYTRATTLQVELATQSYRISGEPAQLQERDAAISARERALARVQSLATDNPQQQQRWLELRELVDRRLAISRQIE